MKTSNSFELNADNTCSMRLIDRLARRAVFSKLGHISRGYIAIIEQGQVYPFGRERAGTPRACVIVRDPGFYSSLAFGGSVGAGEAYFHGDWDCDDLVALVRILLINRQVLDDMDSGLGKLALPVNRLLHWLNRNTRRGSRRNIAAHYDLGNELFEIMLDDTMMYSCAVYADDHQDLYDASFNKLDRICRKLALGPGDHLLEIGTGWGGLAIHAARHYGCRVTTTTISAEQYQLAGERIRAAGLEHRITLLQQDYRELEGRYDKLVSIEMIEAIGQENLDLYFRTCNRLLRDDGLALIQAITIADQRYRQALREVDFIQKYIFPGGSLPSVTAMSESITRSSDLRIFNLEDIGPHYARTLRHWRERFFQQLGRVRELGYSDSFIRLWEFYLCYCEGAFEERATGTVQMLLAKPMCRRQALTPILE